MVNTACNVAESGSESAKHVLLWSVERGIPALPCQHSRPLLPVLVAAEHVPDTVLPQSAIHSRFSVWTQDAQGSCG